MRREVKIGIFMSGVLFIAAVMIFVIGNVSNLLRRGGYPLYVHFDTALGLDESAAVRMAGIKVGYIKDIQLELRRARITLNIFKDFRIPRESKAAQAALGLLGEKYVEIQPSDQTVFYEPGDEMPGLPPSGLDQLAPMLSGVGTEIQALSRSLRDMLAEDSKKNFGQVLANLSTLTADLNAFLAQNKDLFNRSLTNADQAVRGMDQRVRDVGGNLDQAVSELSTILRENREGVRENVEKIRELLGKIEDSLRLLNSSLDKIQRGEGTLGKLINDQGLYEEAETAVRDAKKLIEPVSSLRASLDFRAEYYGPSEFLKSSFSLVVGSPARAFFLGQVVHDPWADKFVYTAQGGWRWGNLAPRAGILESEFGAGLDYYTLRDRFILSLEGTAFDRETSPLLRAFARFFPQKNVFLILGVNDFTLASKSEVYFGLGLALQ